MKFFNAEFRQSIRFRFLIVISVMLFISTIVLSAVLAFKEKRNLERSLVAKGQSMASYIGKLSQDSLLLNDVLQLDAIVNDANKDEDIVYTVIRDAGGRLLTTVYASINFRSPKVSSALADMPMDAELPEIIPAIKKKMAVMQLTVPILVDVKTIGTVTIGMSGERIREQIVQTVLFVLALNLAAAFALGVLLFVSSKRIILSPIAELALAAARLAAGRLSTQVTTKALGEVKTLIDSFNQMAGNLERTTVSRDYVDNIINSMMDTLIVIEPNGTIVRANAAACSLLGYPERELIGLPAHQLIVDETGRGIFELPEMTAQGSVRTVEKMYRSREGSQVPVLFSASALRDVQGRMQGIVCVAQDITERKRAEARLKSYSEELAAINEELKNFAYIVSHDLRAPLVNIKGFSQELDRSLHEIEPCFQKHLPLLDREDREKIGPVLKRDIPEALSFISSSVNRMDRMINAILKLSRAGRSNLSPEPVRVRELVQSILESITHQIGSGTIEIKLDDGPVPVDRTALEQIFGNLLDNAIKYLDPARAGIIVISSERNNEEVVYHVQDNGRGIAEDDIPRAFEIFRRIGPQHIPGEGIGLAYVKTLVRTLGGRIWCSSRLGAGSTFSFSIPTSSGGSRP